MDDDFKLSAGAVLVDFSISVWSGRRQATDEAEAVTTRAKSVRDAASVSKNLMVGTKELSQVQTCAVQIRRFIIHYTLPWSDSGVRLLPMGQFNEFAEGLDKLIIQFNSAVDTLVTAYPTVVSLQAMKLGSLFNRADYPKPDSLRRKFGVHVRMLPVPQAGHYLLDAHNETIEKLQARAAKDQQESVQRMMQDAWKRLYDALSKLNAVTTPANNGGKRPIFESTITGIAEVTALLTSFNITNDPKLEEARVELEQLMAGTTVAKLREDDTVRDTVRAKTQAILDKFDFGGFCAEEEDS
jgi:hypothetical protein